MFQPLPIHNAHVWAWYVSWNRTERHGTISRNFLGINYGMERFLEYSICCLEHSAICGISITILTMSVNEISTRISFRVCAKLLNTAKNH